MCCTKCSSHFLREKVHSSPRDRIVRCWYSAGIAVVTRFSCAVVQNIAGGNVVDWLVSICGISREGCMCGVWGKENFRARRYALITAQKELLVYTTPLYYIGTKSWSIWYHHSYLHVCRILLRYIFEFRKCGICFPTWDSPDWFHLRRTGFFPLTTLVPVTLLFFSLWTSLAVLWSLFLYMCFMMIKFK